MKDFKQQAKEYVRQIYISHRNDDITAWENLIDVLFLYIDERTTQIARKYHPDEPQ